MDDILMEANFIIPQWRKIIWFSLFWLSTIGGTIGNFLVVWVVVGDKKMQTVTNFMILNLAVADGLLIALSLPFASFQWVFAKYPFSHFVCQLNDFIALTCICVKVLTLLMIAIDRYAANVHPLKLRMGRGKAITIMVVLWIVSMAVIWPEFIYPMQIQSDVGEYYFIYGWRESKRLVFLIVTYLLPLFIMICTYSRIGWKKPVGEKSESQMKKDLAKHKLVKMMILIVVIFALCWLPIHIFSILHAFKPLLKGSLLIRELEYWAFWFAISNSVCNPIIYCWYNNRFRAGFKKAFRWCPWINYDAAHDKLNVGKSIAT